MTCRPRVNKKGGENVNKEEWMEKAAQSILDADEVPGSQQE